MASAEIVSNLKLITSGEVPTTSNLGNGELAFGLVGGVAKLYGNVNGTIVDFSDFLKAAPVTSVAGKTGAVTLQPSDIGTNFKDIDDKNIAINAGTQPTYKGTSTAVTFTSGFGISQGIAETSGIWFDGDQVVMWSPCDKGALNYYDEDNGDLVFKIDADGILTRKDGKKALYEGEADSGSDAIVEIDASIYDTVKKVWERMTEIHEASGYKQNLFAYVNTAYSGYMVYAPGGDCIYFFGDGDGLGYIGTLHDAPTNESYVWQEIDYLGQIDNLYFKPEGGIPESDLSAEVQTKLNSGGGGGGTPYVKTISTWSGTKGNYYSTISASTHGKGTYPSVHTYIRNGSLWEETYDSPGIDDSGNVTVYTNSVISIKVVIK